MFPLLGFVASLPLLLDCPDCKDTGQMTCSTCNGDFRSVEQSVKCEKTAGVGCDGKGFRRCFGCNGRGEDPCEICDGDGKVGVPDRITLPGGQTRKTTRQETCTACNGKGKVHCSDCRTIYVREPKGPMLDPFISEGEPLGSREVTVSDWSGRIVVVEENYGAWTRYEHAIRCPRCEGKGRLIKKVACKDCTKGKMPCATCAGDRQEQIKVPDAVVSAEEIKALEAMLAGLKNPDAQKIRAILREYLLIRAQLQALIQRTAPPAEVCKAVGDSERRLKDAGL